MGVISIQPLVPPRPMGILLPMLKFNLFAVLLILTFTTLAANAGEEFGVPGAEAPVSVAACGEGKAYIYKKYMVYARKSPSFEGQDIMIYETDSPPADPCSLAASEPFYTIKAGEFQGANTFAGVYGKYLLIDQWPGEEHKRLLIIDINSKSLVFFDWYAEPVIKDGTLRYKRVLKARKSVRKKIPCPDAGKWEKEGKTALYVEKMSVDLATMKKSASGEFSCIEAEPITKRAAEYTF